jgi:hypothetical protein
MRDIEQERVLWDSCVVQLDYCNSKAILNGAAGKWSAASYWEEQAFQIMTRLEELTAPYT